MLLDIQSDVNAIKNTMNELEKLSNKEKAEEYADRILSDSKYPFIFKQKVKACIIKVYLDSLKCCKVAYNKGLTEGRKEKWHDLREYPTDLPKCAENEQIIFYVQEYYKEIGKYKNHFCLGFYKKSFLNDDVKVFVERSKGYECEHLAEEVLRWCEIPMFEEE